MAKASQKTGTTVVKKSTAKPKATPSVNIEKVAEDILAKLKSLNIEQQLQADLEWCLGSYRFDQNPIGLVEKIKASYEVLKQEQLKKTKGVTATFISSIAKAIA